MTQEKDQVNVLKENKMGTMPIGKLMLSMSLPAMFSMIIQALYNIVDSIFVSRLANPALSLSAVSLVFPIQMLMVAVGIGTGVGLNSLISRRLGEKRLKEADDAASHGLILCFFSWAIFAVFGLLFSGVFIGAFTENPVIYTYGKQYCFIITVCSLFVFTQVTAEKILQATGNMVLPMISNLVGAVTNIILDPILIFGLFGAPKLEVAGAALATVIGQFLAMCLALFFLLAKKHAIRIKIKDFHFNFGVIKNIYAVGLPSMIMQAIGSVMLLGMNAILVTFSDAAVAVLGIYFKLQSFVFMPVFGLNQGLLPIMGYNFGAKQRGRLVHTFKLGMIVAVSIMAAGTILFQIFPIPFMKLFDADAEMLKIGVNALRMISLCFIPAAIGIIASTLFQALGHGILSLWVSLLRQLVLILPMAWALASLLGLDYVWASFPLAEIFSLAASIVFVKKVFKKEINTLGD